MSDKDTIQMIDNGSGTREKRSANIPQLRPIPSSVSSSGSNSKPENKSSNKNSS